MVQAGEIVGLLLLPSLELEGDEGNLHDVILHVEKRKQPLGCLCQTYGLGLVRWLVFGPKFMAYFWLVWTCESGSKYVGLKPIKAHKNKIIIINKTKEIK